MRMTSRLWALTVTTALAAEVDPLTGRVLADQVLSIHPMALRMADKWAREEIPADQVRDRVLTLINHAFDILDHSLRHVE
jgi:hypothetical protein